MIQASSHRFVCRRFLIRVESVRGIPEFPGLDIFKERLLNILVADRCKVRKISLPQAAMMKAGLSASTLCRRLKSLRKNVYLAAEIDGQYRRAKSLTPAAVSNKYVAAPGHCPGKAQRA